MHSPTAWQRSEAKQVEGKGELMRARTCVGHGAFQVRRQAQRVCVDWMKTSNRIGSRNPE